jgi:endo-1,4-beta-xylanase
MSEFDTLHCRRAVLMGMGLIAGACSVPTAAGAGRVIPFGTAMRASMLDQPALVQLMKQFCRSVTPEIEMKWNWAERSRGGLDLGAADRIAGFARSSGMRMRGHTLVWHQGIPPWAEPLLVPGASWDLVHGYMSTVMARYADVVDDWDVVNEPIEPQDGFGGRRVSPFYAAFGRDYVMEALGRARASQPKARLFINEYGLEYDTVSQQARRDALLELIRDIRRSNTPLDGIGLQTHLDLRAGGFRTETYRDFLQAIADFGLRICITEFDIKEKDYPAPVAVRDRLVADHAAAVLEVAMEQPALDSVTCWTMSDQASWLRVEPRDYASYPDRWRDGSSPGLNRGTPFDSQLNPKPLWDVLRPKVPR